ncbi:heterokaryon incompatibility protein-domain-containing protein [Xylariales sp. PMI_506]|nr:heterokaryon incompatibility protein-domain-containing protein [Xylariales sp. PMI_506]
MFPTLLPQLPQCSDGFCESCVQLNLQEIIQTARLQDDLGILVKDVEQRYRHQLKTSCKLCQMLFASRVRLIDEENQATNVDGDEIWVTPYLGPYSLSYRQKERKTMCLVLLPRGFALNNTTSCLSILIHAEVKECAVLLENDQPPSIFTPLQVSPIFNPKIAKNWLNYCTRNHGLPCTTNKAPIHDLHLINCMTLLVEQGNPDVLYVALSYVWGLSKDGHAAAKHIEGRKLIQDQLPAVVKDAIKMTTALGFQYLWIDKYCINQSDAQVKHEQIQQMDAVYQNAQLTIIAAAGKDESHGLPGVGNKPRNPQHIAREKNVTVVWTMADPQSLIRSSQWATRGWTYQEAILSRRCLVFTEEQVYFECNTMHCHESIHTPLGKMHAKKYAKTVKDVRTGIFGGADYESTSLKALFHQYFTNVQEYSARNLSYDQDSLHAFQGIIRRYARQRQSIRDIWGLSYPFDFRYRVPYFVYSLTWYHDCGAKSARRRPEFPSWTWAGWEGPIKHKIEGNKWIRNRVKEICLEDEEGNLLELDQIILPSQYNNVHAILRITAGVLSPRFISHFHSSEIGHIWVIRKYKAELSLSDHTTSENDLAGEIQEYNTVRCIFLGSVGKTTFFMVLKSAPTLDTWSRAGLFKVDCYCNNLESLFEEDDFVMSRIV